MKLTAVLGFVLLAGISTSCNSVSTQTLQLQNQASYIRAYPKRFNPFPKLPEYQAIECYGDGSRVCPPVPSGNDYVLRIGNLSLDTIKQLIGSQGEIKKGAFTEKEVLVPTNVILDLENFDADLRKTLAARHIYVHAAEYNKDNDTIEYWLETK
jgi:hypothetical protein